MDYTRRKAVHILNNPKLMSGRDALRTVSGDGVGASLSHLDANIKPKYAVLEASSPAEALSFAEIAKKYSPKLKAKFLIHMTPDTADTICRTEEKPLPQLPGAGSMAEFAENCPFNSAELRPSSVGVIATGYGYNIAKELYGDTVSILKLGMIHPISRKLLTEFTSRHEETVVIDGTGFIEARLTEWGIPFTGRDRFGGEFTREALGIALLCEEPDFTEIADEVPTRT